MTSQHSDRADLRHYREQVAEVLELRQRVQELADSAKKVGGLARVQDALDELTLRTKNLEDLRRDLSPTSIFLLTYRVEVINDHTVSFVIPEGGSRIELIEKAQQLLAGQKVGRADHLINPLYLSVWRRTLIYTCRLRSAELVCIDGHVPGLDGMTRREQANRLQAKGLSMPFQEDLTAAFAVFYVATGSSLFGWAFEKYESSFRVRCMGDELYFDANGLNQVPRSDDRIEFNFAASARLNIL